jgi:hypothetical protein
MGPFWDDLKFQNVVNSGINVNRGIFKYFSYTLFPHCFICRPPVSTVPGDAGMKPRTVATLALAVRPSNQSARSHPINDTLFYFVPF